MAKKLEYRQQNSADNPDLAYNNMCICVRREDVRGREIKCAIGYMAGTGKSPNY